MAGGRRGGGERVVGGCAACIRVGAVFSRQRSFFFNTVICISGFGVVRWCLTLKNFSVGAWYQKTRRVLLRARRLLLLLLLAAERGGVQCAA